jgi:hypothetical protein
MHTMLRTRAATFRVRSGYAPRYALLATLLLALLVACKKDGGPLDLYGARLGMSAGDLRKAFDPGVSGTMSTTAGDTVTMTWTPEKRSTVNGAEFQFHSGMLTFFTAEVANSDDAAQGPEVWIGPTSVVERQHGPRVTKVTTIARDCPTHAEKVKALIAAGAR